MEMGARTEKDGDMGKLKIILDNLIHIPINDLSPQCLEELELKFTYNNPDYYQKKALKLWVSEKDKYLRTYELNSTWNEIMITRGALTTVIEFFKNKGIEFEIEDKTFVSPLIDHKLSKGVEYYDFQDRAINQLNQWKQGILIADTGSGKTRIMLGGEFMVLGC